MKNEHTTKEFSFCELVQIAEVLNRSEAALQQRYRHLAEQVQELLPRREQHQHISKEN